MTDSSAVAWIGLTACRCSALGRPGGRRDGRPSAERVAPAGLCALCATRTRHPFTHIVSSRRPQVLRHSCHAELSRSSICTPWDAGPGAQHSILPESRQTRCNGAWRSQGKAEADFKQRSWLWCLFQSPQRSQPSHCGPSESQLRQEQRCFDTVCSPPSTLGRRLQPDSGGDLRRHRTARLCLLCRP